MVPGENRHSAGPLTAWSSRGERSSSRVAAITDRSPMTTVRQDDVTPGRVSALAVISGPTPAGSPMVMPNKGRWGAIT